MLEQEIKVLEQALNAANKAGVFGLQDSALIAQSLFKITNFVTTTLAKGELVEKSKSNK